ncbi:MAG: AmmeMemoRadiSam system protein B [Verrucomicrobia bacterium]|nr:AmmeMemoRadiSam system protein B [Verrucomicrobiota bacterium]
MQGAASPVVCHTHGDGRWFPADRMALRDMVEGFLDQADVPAEHGRIVAAVAPHAGFIYSGGVAGHTFRALRDNAGAGLGPDTVIVLGFTHREHFPGVALLDGDAIQSPLGPAGLDRAAAQFLVEQDPCIYKDSAPHVAEHSAENEIPFLQVALPGIPLVVALMGDHDARVVAPFVNALQSLAKERRLLIVASSDMLHNPDYDTVLRTDRATLSLLEAMDLDALRHTWAPSHQPVCGIGPLSIALSFARTEGVQRGSVLCYRNSGDDHPGSRGDWVVGYSSITYSVRDA